MQQRALARLLSAAKLVSSYDGRVASRINVPEHLLGDHRDPSWEDMSTYVVHFTTDREVFARILATGFLKAGRPFGFSWFRNLPEVRNRHRSICFSEVPLDKIERLTRRHGNYGVAFSKDFLRRQQGGRVWYLDQGSTQAQALSQLLDSLVRAREFSDPLWNLTPFIDLVMPGRYEWDWEREWRVGGELRFSRRDVAFVVTPEGIEELPGLDGFYMTPDQDLIVSASPQPLVEYVEQLVQEFFQAFEDPVNSLPVDSGEYVWIVEEWPTEDAVYELFPELEESVYEQLVDYLNSVSWSWVRSEEVASIYE